MGPVSIPINGVWRIIMSNFPLMGDMFSGIDYPSSWLTIVLDIRLPRVLAGVIVGASLAMAGAIMQGIFRNSMADPFIVGVSSGAALGASLALLLQLSLHKLMKIYISPILSFVGALVAVFIVYEISRVDDKVPVETLLLAGVAISSFLSALTSALIYTVSRDVYNVLFWLTGSLSVSKWNDVLVSLITFIMGLSILLFSRDMNAMLLGEDVAKSLGTEVEYVKRVAIVLSSIVTATAVSTSGIIGFVGLIVPHMTRLLVGPDHRVLIPFSALVGGIFLLWCDIIARVFFPLPVGIVTALFGAPFFIYLLKKRKQWL
jgi:iron complex transport system permease protein